MRALATLLTEPRHATAKTYLVQVEGNPQPAQLRGLCDGVVLKDGPTLAAQARVLDAPPNWLWPRDPPVRYRESVPDGWIELTIREGRNRQVRRMTAAVGLPTLRLVRIAIGEFSPSAVATPGATASAGFTCRRDVEETRRHGERTGIADRPAAGNRAATGRPPADRV